VTTKKKTLSTLSFTYIYIYMVTNINIDWAVLCAVLYFRSCTWWVSIELTRILWDSLYVYSLAVRAWEIEFSKEHGRSDWWQRERTLENKSLGGCLFLCCRRRTLLWPVSIHLANRIVETKIHAAFPRWNCFVHCQRKLEILRRADWCIVRCVSKY